MTVSLCFQIHSKSTLEWAYRLVKWCCKSGSCSVQDPIALTPSDEVAEKKNENKYKLPREILNCDLDPVDVGK